jgi:NADH dehydrogenase
MWIFVHILYLVGHRNRVMVLLNWAWSYFTFKRGARLITYQTWKESEGPRPALVPKPQAQAPAPVEPAGPVPEAVVKS